MTQERLQLDGEARHGNPSSTRFALIEAVRGIAAVLVVFSHTADKSGWFYTYVFDPGKLGVVVFFFISGYLVIPSAARDGSAYNFLCKRFFRLYPMYWLSLVLAYLVWSDRLDATDWVANITMAQQLFGFDNAIDVYWTLTIEFVLYTVITAFLVVNPSIILNRFKGVLLVLGSLCIASAMLRWGTQSRIPVAVPLGLFCMFTGAQMRYEIDAGLSVGKTAIVFSVVAIISCAFAYSFSTTFSETPSRYIISYLLGGAIFVLITHAPYLDLGTPLKVLGSVSFGVYLLHKLVIDCLEPYYNDGLVLFLITLIISVIVSAPLYYYYERPLAGYGHKLVKR